MELNQSQISEDLQLQIYGQFYKLSLPEKLIIYSKIKYGDGFKVYVNDLWNINKKDLREVYNAFIEMVRSDLNVAETSCTSCDKQIQKSTSCKAS